MQNQKTIGPKFPFDPVRYINCFEGHQYALDVVSGKIVACKFVIGACTRYLNDISKESDKFWFNPEKAERYLRLTQQFEHVIGKWENPKIEYAPWQKFVWMNIMGFISKITNERRFRTAHIEVPRGSGKAHPLSQDVVTPRGLLKWKDIEVGSELYSRDGTICRVVAKTPVTPQKVFEVEFSDGSIVETSEQHEWYTSDKVERERFFDHTHVRPPKRRNKRGQLVGNLTYESIRETGEIASTLTKRGESNHAVKTTAPIVGEDSILGGLSPYFIGYWLGNGSESSLKVICHAQDKEELAHLFKKEGLEINENLAPKKGSNSLDISVLDIRDKMRDLNLLGNKHIPTSWVNLKYSDRLSLLQGLLDSDGTIDDEGTVEFYNGNYSLILGVKILASSFGFKPVIAKKNISDKNNFKPTMEHYRVSFTVRGGIPVFRLGRKLSRQIERKGKHTYSDKRYIVGVRDTGRYEDMFCVQVDSKDNTYLIGDSLIPTHNSTLASQCTLYFLALEEGVNGNQISCVATKKDQARIVLDSARAMAERAVKFRKATGVEVLRHEIVCRKTNSYVKALSSDRNTNDGRADILSVCDELHAMKRQTFEIVDSGMSKRNDSLLLCITTAGYDVDGVGMSQSLYAKKVALGEVEDDLFFSIVYTIDDGDDIFDENTWKKANPNYGISVDPTNFASKALKAQENPQDAANFKIKHLNIWLGEASAYYSLDHWDRCAADIKMEDFKGQKCYVAVDLANKVDLASIAYIFNVDGKYYFFEKTFVPEERVKEVKSPLYDRAVHDGHLISTPGEAINYSAIYEILKKDSDIYDFIAVHYDPWNATQFSQDMIKDGMEAVEFRMNTSNLSEPTKYLDALIRERKLVHNGSPLLRWAIGNVVCKEDSAGNVFPKKSHEKLKIDPAIAGIMALAGWVQESKLQSSYETEDIVFC